MEVFDPTQEFDVVYRRLPHWSQPGAITFITWRTWDSLPEKVIRQWQEERDAWLKKNGIDPSLSNWQERVERLGRLAPIPGFLGGPMERPSRRLPRGVRSAASGFVARGRQQPASFQRRSVRFDRFRGDAQPRSPVSGVSALRGHVAAMRFMEALHGNENQPHSWQ